MAPFTPLCTSRNRAANIVHFSPSSESYPEVSIPIADSHHLIFFCKTFNDAQAELVSATQTLPSIGKILVQPCLARL